MKTVNLGDKYTHRLTLRLTDGQMDYLGKVSTLLGTTPSEYLRMTINACMISTNKNLETMMNGEALGKVGMSNENIKTDINNQL